MNKSLLTCLTLFVCLAPTSLFWFNIPFTFSDKPSYEASEARSCILRQLRTQASIPFGADFGKFIKESQIAEDEYRIKTIVLDAGHGGRDPGCSGKKSREKDIALGVVMKLGQKLIKSYPHLNIIYTRNRDVFIPLYRRASIANNNNADLFISIHCNYMPGSTATRGSETYVMGLHTAEENLDVAKRENDAIFLEENYQANYDIDPNSDEWHIANSVLQTVQMEQSISFASKVEEEIASYEQRKSRGVKQAGFLVLRETAMPSVLVETGFLSSSRDEAYLLSHAGQNKVAESVFRAFQAYKYEVEDFSTPTYADTPKPSTYDNRYTPTQEERELEEAYRNPINNRPPVVPPVIHPQFEPKEQAVFVKSADREKVDQERIRKNDVDWDEIRLNDLEDAVPGDIANIAISKPPSRGDVREMRAKTPIEYRVQLTSSTALLEMSSARWLELDKTKYWAEPVWEEGQHKYQIMNIQTFSEAEQIRLQMRGIGFFNAYVLAYQGLKQLSVNEAMKLQAK